MTHVKKCLECQKVMVGVAWSRRYCGSKCRQKAYYWRTVRRKKEQEKQKDKTRSR